MKPKNNLLSKKFSILISDEMHGFFMEGAKAQGHEILYRPGATREEIASLLPQMDAWILRTGVSADADLLSNGRSLKWIGRAGAGLDNIDLVQAEKMGIVCENAGEANADAVGEHALGMLLMLMHNLSRAHAEVKAGLWQREANRGIELRGKTVGIIGFGNTGKAVAEKLSGFGVKLLVFDKYKKGFGLNQIQEASLQDIQAAADIISFHVPLTAETKGFLDASFILACHKPFFLLNLSRGKVVNHEDLINGLNQGKVLGAALDVLENEKIATLAGAELERFNTLANAPNVIITPHIGGWTQESYLKISQVLLDKFLYFSGNMK
jgi:D-3-phosphoglycerate dehydrogenase